MAITNTRKLGGEGNRGTLAPFALLLLTKAFRPEIQLGAMTHFVATHLGQRFAERPPLHLGSAFADAKPTTPLIFVLTWCGPSCRPAQIRGRKGL